MDNGRSKSPRRAGVMQQDFEGGASAMVLEEEPEDRS